MNTDTGDVCRLTPEEIEKLKQNWREIDEHALSLKRQAQLSKTGRTKIGRNDPCGCGSGKKFKRCCYTGRRVNR